jgi:hypothetical protein
MITATHKQPLCALAGEIPVIGTPAVGERAILGRNPI